MESKDDEDSEHNIRSVVSKVTVKTLQELTTDVGNTSSFPVVAQPEGTERNQSEEPDGLTSFPVLETRDLLPFNEDDEGGNIDEEDGITVSDGELESNEVVVLDPDHPLMRPFQLRVKKFLEERNNALELELREARQDVSMKKKQREDVGVELYGIQQEHARYQQTLENLQDLLSEVKRLREANDLQLAEARKTHQEQQNLINMERKKDVDLRSEIDNISLRLFYLENAKKEVHSDIAVMKRAAEKAESEVTRAEETKRQQDLYVNRLVERLEQLREDITLFDAQLEAEISETREAGEALAEARIEIDAIIVEKRQLFTAWNSALIGMRRRDEALAAMSDALNEQQQRVISIDLEIDAFRRLIQKEQQKNEELTFVLYKAESEVATVKKMLGLCQGKLEALKEQFSTYSRILLETEESLRRANVECNHYVSQLDDMRKETERRNQEKLRLEDEILHTMRDQLTADKAAQYSSRLLTRLRERTKELETQIAASENDIAKSMLDHTQLRAQIELIQKTKADLDKDIEHSDQLVAKVQAEIYKNNTTIKRKTDQMEHLNAKIEKMIAAAGGIEASPMELQINSLQKSVEVEAAAIIELKQLWLREQNELVRLSADQDQLSAAVDIMTKQHTVLVQKRIRVEAEISMQEAESVSLEREIHRLQVDLSKLDALLYTEEGTKSIMESENQLLEALFIATLKDAERESIQLQDKLDSLQEEKERLANSLIEAERQMMLWEKKTQLAKETRAAVDSDFGQGEIAAMKSEIHRMQVRHTQLMKQQEKMIQDMEKLIERREVIAARGDFIAKNGSAKLVTKGALHHQITDLRKKIKQTLQEASSCDVEMRELKEQQKQFGTALDDRQARVQQLQSTMDALDAEIERHAYQKQVQMVDLLADQQKTKYYQQWKENKYSRSCKSLEALDAEKTRQEYRMSQIVQIVEQLCRDYPQHSAVLRSVITAFGSRGPAFDTLQLTTDVTR